MKIYTISDNYVDYLKGFDFKAPDNKNSKRPYVGVVFSVNGSNFFAPLSSPKLKHLTMKEGLDLIKIENGEYGVVNLNNMIPVPLCELSPIDFSKQSPDYSFILKQQGQFFRKNEEEIKEKAKKLYSLYKKGYLNENLKFRCCNFPLLEKKCAEWEKNHKTKTVETEEERNK
jgi:protein AbiQ